MTHMEWKGRRERWVFAGLLALHVAPIWFFAYLPTQDGPAHLANAAILRRLLTHSCAIVSEFYEINWQLAPNWNTHLILAGLGALFPATIAEKVVQTAQVAGLAYGLRFAIQRIAPTSRWLSLLALPFVFSSPFLMGFYGFSLGIVFYPLILAWWLPRAETASGRDAIGLAGLALVSYFFHPLSFVISVSGLGFVLLARAWPGDSAGRFSRMLRFGRLPALALLPSLGLLAAFLLRPTEGGIVSRLSPFELIDGFARARYLVSYGTWETWIAPAVTLLLVAAIAIGLRQTSRTSADDGLRTGLGLQVVFLFALLFALPDSVAGGGYVSERIMLLFSLSVILWFAACQLPATVLSGAAIAGAVVALALNGAKVSMLPRMQEDLREYLLLKSEIEPGTVVMPMNYFPGTRSRGGGSSLRPDITLHAAGYLSADRCLVNVNNYEAGRTDYFPIRFRPGKSPYSPFIYSDYLPERSNLSVYFREAGRRPEYFLLWGLEQSVPRSSKERLELMREQIRSLEIDYESVARSEPMGRMFLYRSKSLGVDTPL